MISAAKMHTWSFSCSVCKGLLPDLTGKLFRPEICSEATSRQQKEKMRNGNKDKIETYIHNTTGTFTDFRGTSVDQNIIQTFDVGQ